MTKNEIKIALLYEARELGHAEARDRCKGGCGQRALDCVNMTHAGDVIMLLVRRSAAKPPPVTS